MHGAVDSRYRVLRLKAKSLTAKRELDEYFITCAGMILTDLYDMSRLVLV